MSIHTAILVGLVVAWQLHERLGWAFAGFVVTGYLAALAMVSPPTLAVVVVESVLTFAAARTLAEGLPGLGWYAPVFGRERFLLYVIVSLPVRLLCTGVAMPPLAAWLVAEGYAGVDLEASLAGLGVVLVPLVANTLHKPGLIAGAVQVGTAATLTWAALAFGVAPFTNLALEGLSGSLDVLNGDAMPPARSLLLLFTTAFIAAHNNLRYGWDFGGVLVPALLAVLALEPARLAATVIEVFWLYAAWRALRVIPAVAALDVGGPRRIVSMYAVSWALHGVLAWVALWTDLPIVVGDSFGFGYLLTSLVVTRCVAAGPVRTVAPLVFTAAQGVAASACLALLMSKTGPTPRVAPGVWTAATEVEAAVQLAESAAADAAPGGGLGEAWAAPSAESVAGCQVAAGRRARVLRCREEGPVLVVARPRFDPDGAWLAGWLAGRVGASAIVIAAADPSGHPSAGRGDDAVAAALAEAREVSRGAAQVVVVEAAVDRTEVWGRGAPPVALLGALSMARLGAASPEGPVWPLLAEGEALLRVWPGDVAGTPTGTPADPVRAAATVVGALVRHGATLRGRPGAVAWLAALGGAAVVERGDGYEVVVGGDRFVVRPDGAPWLVASEPGGAAAAAFVADQLGAVVSWVGELGPDRRVRRPDGRTEVEDLARALLPAQAARGLVLVGVAPREHGAPSLGRAGPGDAAAEAAVLAAWPGASVGASVEVDARPPIAELAFRQAALGAPTLTLLLPRGVAREGGTESEAWWAARGAVGPLAVVEGLPTSAPDVALQALADAPTAMTLVAAQTGGSVVVGWVGPRQVVSRVSEDRVCRAVAGAGRALAPVWSGCWERP